MHTENGGVRKLLWKNQAHNLEKKRQRNYCLVERKENLWQSEFKFLKRIYASETISHYLFIIIPLDLCSLLLYLLLLKAARE
jgi:hypothetical protein